MIIAYQNTRFRWSSSVLLYGSICSSFEHERKIKASGRDNPHHNRGQGGLRCPVSEKEQTNTTLVTTDEAVPIETAARALSPSVPFAAIMVPPGQIVIVIAIDIAIITTIIIMIITVIMRISVIAIITNHRVPWARQLLLRGFAAPRNLLTPGRTRAASPKSAETNIRWHKNETCVFSR